MTKDQQAALTRTLFDERGGLRANAVGQSAIRLAEMSGFAVPASTKVLAAELDEVGDHVLLSREILGPVLTVYREPDYQAGWRRCREILALGGEGHTVAVHTSDPEVVAKFGELPAGRIVVNTPACSAEWATRRTSTRPSRSVPVPGVARSARTTSHRYTW